MECILLEQQKVSNTRPPTPTPHTDNKRSDSQILSPRAAGPSTALHIVTALPLQEEAAFLETHLGGILELLFSNTVRL